MTETEKLRDDLAYVRAALNRQRRFACEVLPLWLAATIGALFVGLTMIKDLETMGRVSESVTDSAVIVVAVIGMIAVLIKHAGRRRKERRQPEYDRPRPDRWHKQQSSLQALIFIVGYGVLNYALDQAGISGKMDDIISFTYLAACMMLMGLGGLHLLLWFGVGAGAGAIALLFFDIAFAKTVVGIFIAAGLITGAWLDRRALSRSEG